MTRRNYVTISISYNRRIQYLERLQSYSTDLYRTNLVNQLNLPADTHEHGAIRIFATEEGNHKYNVLIGYRTLLISSHQIVTLNGSDPVASLLSQCMRVTSDLKIIGEYVTNTVFSSENIGLGVGVLTLDWDNLEKVMDSSQHSDFVGKLGDFIWSQCVMDMWVYSQRKIRYETLRDSSGNLSPDDYFKLSNRMFLRALLCESVSIFPNLPLPFAAEEWVKCNLFLMDAFYEEIDCSNELEIVRKELAKGLKWYWLGPSGGLERRRLELTNHVNALKHRVGKYVKAYLNILEQTEKPLDWGDYLTIRDPLIDVKKTGFPTTFITSTESHIEARQVVNSYNQNEFLDFGLEFLQKEFEIQRSIGTSRLRNIQLGFYILIILLGIPTIVILGGTDWLDTLANYLQVAMFFLLVIFLLITIKRD